MTAGPFQPKTMGMRLLLALALLTVGCGTPDPAADATAIVLDAYGASDLAPSIEWHMGTDECNGKGWREPGRHGCAGGFFDPKTPNLVQVATWVGAYPSDTGLAHELRHLVEFNRNPSIDLTREHAHDSGAFAAGAVVDQANAALRAAGL